MSSHASFLDYFESNLKKYGIKYNESCTQRLKDVRFDFINLDKIDCLTIELREQPSTLLPNNECFLGYLSFNQIFEDISDTCLLVGLDSSKYYASIEKLNEYLLTFRLFEYKAVTAGVGFRLNEGKLLTEIAFGIGTGNAIIQSFSEDLRLIEMVKDFLCSDNKLNNLHFLDYIQDNYTGSAVDFLQSPVEIPIKPVYNMGCTQSVGSDRYPYTIIQVVSDYEIVVQEDDYNRIDQNGMSEDQKYEYAKNYAGQKYTLTLRKNGRWITKGQPTKRGNSWCIGKRNRYYNFSF